MIKKPSHTASRKEYCDTCGKDGSGDGQKIDYFKCGGCNGQQRAYENALRPLEILRFFVEYLPIVLNANVRSITGQTEKEDQNLIHALIKCVIQERTNKTVQVITV